MATDNKRKKFLHLERERMIRYQHQHRGLDFLKLWIPPTTDRKVNIIGQDNHIYRGQIPTYPLDQLPPEVDPKSIDEEKLFKEIRDMRFPIVPPLQPLGPARRIGGKYTTSKRMTFAPVQINLDDDKTETPIIGADGKIYKGTTEAVPVHEMDPKIKGTSRSVKTPAMYSSSRGTVKPTVVSLYVDGKPPSESKPKVPLIELPYADLNKLMKLMQTDSSEQEKGAPGSKHAEEQPTEDAKDREKDSKHTSDEDKEKDSKSAGSEDEEKDLKSTNEADLTSDTSREFTSSGSVGTSGETSDLEETSTTSVTAGSSEITDAVSEGEEKDMELVSESEASESEPGETSESESEPEEKKEVTEPDISKTE